jgi:hypothetical protein
MSEAATGSEPQCVDRRLGRRVVAIVCRFVAENCGQVLIVRYGLIYGNDPASGLFEYLIASVMAVLAGDFVCFAIVFPKDEKKLRMGEVPEEDGE